MSSAQIALHLKNSTQKGCKSVESGKYVSDLTISFVEELTPYIIIVLEQRVNRLAVHPSEASWVIASVLGNNEVSMWNLETKQREKTLWASSVNLFSVENVSQVIVIHPEVVIRIDLSALAMSVIDVFLVLCDTKYSATLYATCFFRSCQ